MYQFCLRTKNIVRRAGLPLRPEALWEVGGAAFAPISEMLMYQMRTLPGMPLTVHELIYSQIVLYNFVEDAWDHLMIFILASIEDLVSGIFKLLN